MRSGFFKTTVSTEDGRDQPGLQRQFHRVMSILDVRQREVRIVDPAALRRLVAGDAG